MNKKVPLANVQLTQKRKEVSQKFKAYKTQSQLIVFELLGQNNDTARSNSREVQRKTSEPSEGISMLA